METTVHPVPGQVLFFHIIGVYSIFYSVTPDPGGH